MTTLPAKWRPVVVDGVDAAFFRVAAVHPVCAPICHLRDCLHYFRYTHTHTAIVYPYLCVCVWRCVERFSEFIFKMRHNDDDNTRSQFGSVRFGSFGSQRGKGNRVVVVVLYICFLDFRTLSGSKNKFDGISTVNVTNFTEWATRCAPNSCLILPFEHWQRQRIWCTTQVEKETTCYFVIISINS